MTYVGIFNMDVSVKSFLLVLLCCYLYTNSIKVEASRRLSKEENLELEQQLSQLNKPPIITIQSKYGVLYDCVDFYKQPAFDHPSLKNHNFHFQMKPSSVPRTTEEKLYVSDVTKANHANMEVVDCPFGTVPIRRVTKADLIRNKLHEERFGSDYSMLSLDNPGTHYAVARTTSLKPGISYNGGGTSIAVYNPHVENSQYSSGRMKIQNGIDSFQYGWMVNPTLYGDNATHGFTYLNTSQSKCFNVLCPGFILVRSDYPIDGILTDVSSIGGKKFAMPFLIYKDELNGNWWLEVGPNNTQVGFWPQRIFTDLAGKATSVQWGGEVSGPPDVPVPIMGTGYFVDYGDLKRDAYCNQMTTINDAHEVVDAKIADIEIDYDNEIYSAVYKEYVDSYFKHLMFFGGPNP